MPRSLASCRNFASPSAPLFRNGTNCCPDLPKISIAIAVFLAGSSIFAIASAMASNCASGDICESSATLNPRSANDFAAASLPPIASTILFCSLIKPPSRVSSEVPDIVAAYSSSDRASTLAPVRWLISSRREPAETNAATAPPNAATPAAPAVASFEPKLVTLDPHSFSRFSLAFRPRMKALSSRNSSTCALPARTAPDDAAMSEPRFLFDSQEFVVRDFSRLRPCH